MMRGNYKKDKGYALMTVLIFFTVLLIIGLGLGYITQKGYLSISAEAKFAKAEKLANMGLLAVIENGTCGNYTAEGINGGKINVIAIKDNGTKNCLVWSEGNYSGARVVKTAIFSLSGSNWGAGIFKKLNNLSGLGGDAAIVGYDYPENYCNDTNSCMVPALVTGNDMNSTFSQYYNKLNICSNNTSENNLGSGLLAYRTDPYKYDPDLANKDLTELLFNAHNRTEMLVKLSEVFKVQFSNGKPDGILNPDLGPYQLGNVNNCEASGNKISCDNKRIEITWNGTHYVYNGRGYQSIDFGQNAQITIEGNFTGGGIIAGNYIKFEGDVIPQSSGNPTTLTLIARNQIEMSSNKIDNVQNTFMFAQNYNIDANSMTVENSLIYSGGNLTIKLNSNTKLGTQESPVLIISDDTINIEKNGTPHIWGVIFATENNNNFKISGNGNLKIHGTVISNSNSTNQKIDLSGNFEIRFNFKTIEKLYKNLSGLVGFNFLKPPVCGDKRKLLKLTGMRVY